MLKKNKKSFSTINIGELSHQSETLLANIRFASVDEPVKTVMITSTIVNEGKSTMALALATAMAKDGKRTLLIDCDMRRRSLGSMLGMHPEGGIFAVLSGRMPVKKVVTQTATSNLYFLDCESNIANPASILSSVRFSALLATLRKAFDYVVIDTPPLSLFVDAAVVSSLVDGVALVVRQRAAKKHAVQDAVVQLKAANARVLGIVLTFAQKNKDDYYYYTYYNEENKRVKKKRSGKGSTVVSEQVIEANPGFSNEDPVAWARRVGVSVEAVQRSAANARHNGRATGASVKTRQGVQNKQNKPDTLPSIDTTYPSGAFKQ